LDKSSFFALITVDFEHRNINAIEYEMNSEELIYKNLEKKINEAFGNRVFITFDEMNRLGKGLDSRDIKKIYDYYLKRFESWKEYTLNEYIVLSVEYDNFKTFENFFNGFMFPIRDEEKEEYYDKYVKLFNKMRKKVEIKGEAVYQLDKEKSFKEALEILKKIPSKELIGENKKPLLDKMRKYVLVNSDV